MKTEKTVNAIAMALGTLGAGVLLVLPGLVSALKYGYGFTDVELGYLSSGHLSGLTVGAAIGGKLIARLGIKKVVRSGLLVAVGANAAAIFVHTYRPLLDLMVVAGVGAGVAIAACFVVLGQSTHVDRNFSIYNVSQVLFGAIALKSMPALSGHVGAGGIFGLLSLLFAASVVLLRYLPAVTQSVSGWRSGGARAGVPAWIALAAILIFFAGQGAVWAYLELIGEHHGASRQATSTAVALSSLLGIAGATMAAVLEARFGRFIPLFVGLCATLVSLHLLRSALDATLFTPAACLFSVAWNFSSSYLPGVITNADGSGRLINWVAFVTLAGVATGPLVGASVLDVTSLGGILWLGAALCILSFAGLVPAATAAPRDARP